MCRSTDLVHHPSSHSHDGDDAINIKALFVHARTSASGFNDPLPLTVLFNAPIHSLSLHRFLNHPLPHALFAAKLSLCLRRRRWRQPLSFQLFLGEALLLKGTLVEQDQHRWTLDCKSQLHLLQSSISEVQLCFAFDDGNLAATNWVRLGNPKERVKYCVDVCRLEQIPEETELPSEDSHGVLDLEQLRRTVDLGIWVLCLGLGAGYLVSRASVRKFRAFLNL
ncbi:uncharacterized protein LOC129312105 [Prosopis cineraria]|uniref:uncharacterized protein LOC129312105 n=1 Tax=Prosopis cineraria TaxID=364024 RepID=UPI002410A539|nr:uncharacterized protein LOC129312105 [Prosopis cineraria]